MVIQTDYNTLLQNQIEAFVYGENTWSDLERHKVDLSGMPNAHFWRLANTSFSNADCIFSEDIQYTFPCVRNAQLCSVAFLEEAHIDKIVGSFMFIVNTLSVLQSSRNVIPRMTLNILYTHSYIPQATSPGTVGRQKRPVGLPESQSNPRSTPIKSTSGATFL